MNMADNTEALKHGFFFWGFFKQNGFYSLKDLPPDQHPSNPHFDNPRNRRAWLNAADAFGNDPNGDGIGSAAGEQEIDRVTGTARDSVIDQPILIEGYSNRASAPHQVATSGSCSLIVAQYLKRRFHRSAKNIRLMPWNAAAAPSSGKASWGGAWIVLLADAE
jgi:phospholipid/cholesterol/gamma-HCH transport system substrate-binding protein